MSAILRTIFASLLPLGAVSSGALAADFPVKAPPLQPSFDWAGAYVGAHTGYGWGRSNGNVFDPSATTLSGNYGGVIGGIQGGYNVVLPSRVLFGFEADMSFPSYLESNNVAATVTTPNATLVEKLDYASTVRGRLGYAAPNWMIYATAGFAWAGERFLNTTLAGSEEKKLYLRTGWTAGAGIEVPIAPQWSAKLEYLYSDYGTANIGLGSGTRINSALDFQSVRIGLNRKIDASTFSGASSFGDTESNR